MAGVVVAMNSVSCLKESAIDQMYRPEGTEIIFAAADTYESIEEETRVDFYGPDSLIFDTAAAGEVEAETRTIFSGSESNGIERINWVNGDSMSIEYERGSNLQTGVYGVISRSASGTKDNATVTNISGTTLNWLGGSGTHKFYAMYPEATFTSAANGPTIKGTIPSSQSVTWNDSQKKYLPSDMTKCYMVGYTTVTTSSPTSRVAIPFVPAVTMFEFNLKRASSGTTYVKSATLTATNLTGTFQFKLTGGTNARGSDWWNHTTSGTNPTSISSPGNSITVSFASFNSGKGATMTNTTALNFTMLALPISYTNPVLTLVMSTDNGTTYFTKKVTLANTFAACKKHVITNNSVPNESWVYTFVHTGTTKTVGSITYQEIVRSESSNGNTGSAPFTSSRQEAGSGETTYAVSDFTYAYAPDSNGSPGTFSSTKPTGLSSTTVPSNTSTSKTIYGTWAANSGTSITTLTQLRGANMRSKGSVGSESAPQDLALSTVATSGITFRTSGPTTANCYIVDRPGWYMFPLVYGNAIVSGSTNSASYTTSASVSNGWSTLHNYKGSNISSPYIPTDVGVTSISSSALNATIVWQDAAGTDADPTFISQVSVISKPSGAAVNTSYIKFYVDPATVHPGNAVIALRNGSTIIWSWHIWLTDGVDTNSDGKGDGFPTFVIKKHPNYTNAKTQNSFLQIPLGACETGTVSGVSESRERAGWVRVTQTASGKELYFRIVQRGAISGTATITNKDISPTFYQWGRKDPFLPRKGGTNTSNKDCTGSTPTLSTSVDNSAAKSIQNPTYFYYTSAYGATNWLSTQVINLWNMNQTSEDEDCTVTKTVYDPCPPGFSLPNRNAFQNFSTSGGNGAGVNASGSWSDGWNFYTEAQGSGNTYYFKAFGWRESTTGAIGQYKSLIGIWTSSGNTGYVSKGMTSTNSRCYAFGNERSSYAYPIFPAAQ